MNFHDATHTMCLLQNYTEEWPAKHDKPEKCMIKYLLFIGALEKYCIQAMPDVSKSEALLELILFKSAEKLSLEDVASMKCFGKVMTTADTIEVQSFENE